MPEREYPIEIARELSTFKVETSRTAAAILGYSSVTYHEYEWALTYPADSSPVWQVLIYDKGEENPLFYRNIGINDVFGDGGGYLLRGFFYDKDGNNELPVANVIPSEENLKFLIATWLFSDEGIFQHDPDVEVCDECGSVTAYCEEDHFECNSCDEQVPSRATDEWQVWTGYSDWDTIVICTPCSSDGAALEDVIDVHECYRCDKYTNDQFGYDSRLRGLRSSQWLCMDCWDELYYCESCDQLCDADEFQGDYCVDCQLSEGDEYDEENDTEMGGLINAWDYRPPMVFFPPLPKNPFRPVYIGIEFELNWYGYNDSASEWISDLGQHGDLLYAKSDSSINEGFEVCSMPMDPDWALENFPFEIFQEAIDLGADPEHHSTGMHIHMDRTAFTTAQMWKMMQIHKVMPDLCQAAGGRDAEEYGSFLPEDNEDLRTNQMFIARRKGVAYENDQRYVALNQRNEDTIELRYMQGGIQPENIKKNIQWVKALYDFTDHINVEDVKNGVLSDRSYLLNWITDEEAYPQLAKFVKSKVWMSAKMPDREKAVI